jgi:ribosomal-protein-alanine N-acetyltransferase
VQARLRHNDDSLRPVELRTGRLLLRAFEFADVDDVLAYEQDPRMSQYQPPGPPFARADAEAMVRRRITQRPSWAIIVPSADRPRRPVVGHVRCSVWAGSSTAELAYAIAPSLWGQGLATEAASAVLDHAFATLGLHKIFAAVVEANVGSIRVLEKLGMLPEGRLREQVRIHDGTVADVLNYGVLREEWERRT